MNNVLLEHLTNEILRIKATIERVSVNCKDADQIKLLEASIASLSSARKYLVQLGD